MDIHPAGWKSGWSKKLPTIYFVVLFILALSRIKWIYSLEFDRYSVWYRYQVPIPGIGICMKRIGMNQVSVSVRYEEYGGYWYRFGIEDMDMGDISIGISVSYPFFNVISVSYICIKIGMNLVSVSYRYIGIGISLIWVLKPISVSVYSVNLCGELNKLEKLFLKKIFIVS